MGVESDIITEQMLEWRAPVAPDTTIEQAQESTTEPKPKMYPVGPLAEVLFVYEAPEDVETRIARRAGLQAGTKALPITTVESVIHRTMEDNSGMPDWDRVEQRLGTIVSDIYRKGRKRA